MNHFLFVIIKKGDEKMQKGRPKGGTNKYWSAEEKYKVIKPILEFEKVHHKLLKKQELVMVC